MVNDTLTAIKGLRVGHAAAPGSTSGCTVVLPEGGATAGVDIRGGAPGTYGTDVLHPVNLVDRMHGLFFTGGSAFGLGVAEGVMRHLSERGTGFDTGHGLVPIVGGAVIFDLGVSPAGPRPDGALGYQACLAASTDPVPEGCTGAGLGATVGKLHGLARAMKGGLGSACIETSNGIQAGALMVVNAFGDIVDPERGQIVAGCRTAPDSLEFADAERELAGLTRLDGFPEGRATLVGTVATNVRLNKAQLTKVAQMAQDGIARAVYPAHTMYDGDTIFALSCGDREGVDVSVVGALAARAVAQAILRGVRKAVAAGGFPAFADREAAFGGRSPGG